MADKIPLHHRLKSLAQFDVRKLNWKKIGLHLMALIAIVSVLLGATLAGLDTPVGRRWLVGFATGLKLNSGLKIEIGCLDGSLYGEMTLHDLKLRDPKGVFLISPEVHLDWRPFGYLNKHVDIRDLSSPRIEMLRQPQLNPSQDQDNKGPLLPDLKIDVTRIRVDQFILDAPVLGEAHTLTLSGSTHIAHRQLQIEALAFSEKADRLQVNITAIPDQNRLDMDARLNAPKAGMAAQATGIDQGFTSRLSGHGDWHAWTGHLTTELGETPLMDLGLTAKEGLFALRGDVHPAQLLTGQRLTGQRLTGESAALLKPAVHIDLTATLKDRVLNSQLALTTDAAAVTATGQADLGHNRFSHLAVQARLLKPQVLGSDFTSDDLRADLILDGDFDHPQIDYDVAAKRLGLGKLRLTGLSAKGHSRLTNSGAIIPVEAQLTTLTGINAQVDPLLTHLKLQGELRLKDGHLSTANLNVRSDRLKASGEVTGTLADNAYAANLKASLDKYAVAGVATINLDATAKLALRNGRFSANGAVTGRTTKLDTEGLRTFLGGNAKASGTFAYAENGVFSLSGLRLKSPDFELYNTNGRISPNGAIALNAKANSKAYGPLDLVASGTLDQPQATLHAAHPGLGLEIAQLTATLKRAPLGYALTATGDSAYGPFSADTNLITDKGPLVIDIHTAHIAGIDLSGQLTQAASGPFDGTLALSGSGLNGTAQLSSQDGDQAAMLKANGHDIRLPGTTDLRAGRAIITASAVLHDQADITADIQMADMHYGDLSLSTGRAKLILHGANGTVQALAHGQKEVPFDIAVNGIIAPDLYTLAAQGQANGVPFHLDRPARIRKSGESWQLDRTRLILDHGSLDLSGTFGSDLKIQARLNGMDLALANMVRTDLGITGTANGSIDLAQNPQGLLTGRAQVKLDNFSRSTAAVASTPVSMVIDARLDANHDPQDNYLHAIVRDHGAVVGRVQIGLAPGDAGPLINRLMNAQISGGVRYNGPAEVPFSLAGLAGQQLSGTVAIAADMSGQISAPQLTGVVKAGSLTYDNDTFGTRITAIALDGRFTNDRLELTAFSGRAGEGTVKASGWLSLAAGQHFPMALHADLNTARLSRSDSLNSTVSGTLDVTNDSDKGPLIAGDLRLPQLKYTVVRQGVAEVNTLTGVHRKGETLQPVAPDDSLPSQWKLDIKAKAPNQIFVSGMGLESEWSANVHISGTTGDPRMTGTMQVIRGTYSFAGRAFTISTGTIRFDGGPVVNPELALTASATVNDVQGVITISGTAQRPSIAFSSTPSLPQDEILSRMLFGESVANISATEALQLASAVNGLNGGHDYLNPLGALRSATGIDRLRIVSADATTGRGTALAAGKYLTNNVYVEIVTDTKGFTATQLEIALSKSLSLLSQMGNTGTSASVKYSKDY